MSYVNVQDRQLPFFVRYMSDLISYRHLCWNLVSSDLRSRFRRTRLGILWAVAQPLGFALMIALVWGGMQRGGATDYWAFAFYVFTGHIVFEMFGTTVIGGQDSLAGAAGYIKQARIPFFIFQVRTVLTGSVVFFFALIGVFVFGLATQKLPPVGLHLLLVPAFFGIYLLFLIPIAMLMSITGLLFRDVKHIAQMGIQGLFLTSPVMLPREVLAQPHLKFMEFVNPLVPMLDMFRAPVLYGKFWDPQSVAVVSIWIVGLWLVAMITATSVGRKLVYAV